MRSRRNGLVVEVGGETGDSRGPSDARRNESERATTHEGMMMDDANLKEKNKIQ